MKRAGILLIVLAVLAAGFMAAANIVVADTGDEAHFESALLSGSREGVEGVRVSGRRSTRTVNDGYMDFVLGYDAASGVSESSFELGGRSSGEVPVDYGTYNFDIFDGLSSGGSSSGDSGNAELLADGVNELFQLKNSHSLDRLDNGSDLLRSHDSYLHELF